MLGVLVLYNMKFYTSFTIIIIVHCIELYFLHGDCTCSLQSDADMILPSRVSRSNWSPCACDQKSTSSQSEHAEWSRNYAYFGVQYLHHNDKTIQLYFAHLLHCSKQQLLSRGAKKLNVYIVFFVIDDEKCNMHCDFFAQLKSLEDGKK